MNLFDIPGDRIRLEDDPCPVCHSTEFVLLEKGPHVSRQCGTCGSNLGFVKREKVGLEKRDIRRDGIDPVLRAEVFQRWKHRCAWCGIPASDAIMHVGHIIPRAKVVPLYGAATADHLLNLAPSCETCNAGAHLTSDYAVNLLLAALRLGVGK